MTHNERTSFPAPLSDHIQRCRSGDESGYDLFLEAFSDAKLGIHVEGLEPGTSGQVVSDGSMRLGNTVHPDGVPRLMAFADPDAFAQRFGQRFNAVMTGEQLMQIAIANPNCQGILVNSALSEASMAVSRETALGLVGVRSRR